MFQLHRGGFFWRKKTGVPVENYGPVCISITWSWLYVGNLLCSGTQSLWAFYSWMIIISILIQYYLCIYECYITSLYLSFYVFIIMLYYVNMSPVSRWLRINKVYILHVVCLSPFLPHRNSSISTWPVCTRHKQDFIPFSIDSRCLLQIGDESHDICICSHIYVSKCMYVYVHIQNVSLFLPECACTTIIDISPRIFSLMYCCFVSIIIVICICPPGALIWLINLFLFLYLSINLSIL